MHNVYNTRLTLCLCIRQSNLLATAEIERRQPTGLVLVKTRGSYGNKSLSSTTHRTYFEIATDKGKKVCMQNNWLAKHTSVQYLRIDSKPVLILKIEKFRYFRFWIGIGIESSFLISWNRFEIESNLITVLILNLSFNLSFYYRINRNLER